MSILNTLESNCSGLRLILRICDRQRSVWHDEVFGVEKFGWRIYQRIWLLKLIFDDRRRIQLKTLTVLRILKQICFFLRWNLPLIDFMIWLNRLLDKKWSDCGIFLQFLFWFYIKSMRFFCARIFYSTWILQSCLQEYRRSIWLQFQLNLFDLLYIC